jgi:hypothetical protein
MPKIAGRKYPENAVQGTSLQGNLYIHEMLAHLPLSFSGSQSSQELVEGLKSIVAFYEENNKEKIAGGNEACDLVFHDRTIDDEAPFFAVYRRIYEHDGERDERRANEMRKKVASRTDAAQAELEKKYPYLTIVKP